MKCALCKLVLFPYVVVSTVISLSACTAMNESRHVTEEFNVEWGDTVKLDVSSGSIEVETWEQKIVSVVVRNANRYSAEELDLSLDQDRNSILVTAELNRSSPGGRNLIYVVKVPQVINLDFKTGSGAIRILNDITGNVNIETGNGHVELANIIEGDLTISGRLGRIAVGDVQGSVDAATTLQHVSIGNVEGQLNVSTSGGRIQVGDVGGNVTADTTRGDINVGLAEGHVIANSTLGGIEILRGREGVQATTTGGRIAVNESGGSVVLANTGGPITIGPTTGPIEASGSGDTISASLLPSEGDSSVVLEAAFGDLTISLPADHSGTVYADLTLDEWAQSEYGINSDFPLSIQSSSDRGRMTASGDINDGGDEIRLVTKNGNINILIDNQEEE